MTPTDPARPLRAVDGQRVPFAERTVDLAADPPPITWAVQDLAARGTLTLLAAPTSAGKTWLALQLANAVARGSDVAGLSCQRGSALYVDGENGHAIIANRLASAGVDRDGFVYVDGGGLQLERADVRAELADAVRHHGATFVVLDSLRRLAPSVREDSSDDMAQLIGGLANVARATDAAVLLQHHRSTKDGAAAVRGSSAIEDQADAVFSLNGKASGMRQHLAPRKFRLGREPHALTLRFRDEPPGFVALRPGPVQAGLAREVAALTESVREAGSWTTGQLGEALGLDLRDDADRKRLTRALATLVEAGEWERPSKGRYAPAPGAMGHGTHP